MKSKLPTEPTRAMAALACALLAGFGKPVQADEPFVQWATTASNLSGVALCSAPGGAVLSAPRNTLLRFDADGHLIASNTIPFFEAHEIQTDTTGAIYLAGMDGPNHNTFSVAKLHPDGTLIWKINASNPQPDLYHGADALAINSTGSVYAVGVSQGPVSFGDANFADGNGLLISRLDQDGRVLWAKRIPDAEQGPAHSLALDPNGNFIFSGYLPPNGPMDFLGSVVNPGKSSNSSGFGGDYFVAKCDPDGNLLWVRVGDLHLNDTLTSAQGMCSAVDRQGNTYYLEGAKWFGKLDTNGNLVWWKSFPGAFLRQSLGIAIDAADEPVFCGQIDGTVSFDAIQLRSRTSDVRGFFLAKSDTNGTIRWAIAGGSSAHDNPFRVACDIAGNIFLGATIEATGAFDGISLPAKPDSVGITALLAKISERPLLRITNAVGSTTLTYPAKATNYVLETSTSLAVPDWVPAAIESSLSGRDRKAQLDTSSRDAGYFRLRKP